MNWNARKSAIAAIIVLSLTTATSTSMLAVMVWKQSHAAATVSAPAPQPGEPEVAFNMNGPGELKLRPGKDGTMHVRTEDGDFIVTNGVNHIVTTDEQGNTREMTIVTDENGGGGRRINVMRSIVDRGGPARVRAGTGPGAGAGGGGINTGGGAGGGGFGGAVRVEEDVLAPPTPEKP